MALVGKGWYIWQIRRCEGGSAAAIADQAAAAGLTHVLIKITDGTNAYNIDPTTGVDLVPPVIQALRKKGVLCYGWQYVYGYDPLGEANIAVQRCRGLGVDGFVIDAEDQYQQPGRDVAARTYMARLRESLPNLPIALSSYRYPSYHPGLPWEEFLQACDFNMPQVYWVESDNPAEQLTRSVREFESLSPSLPVIPTGSAYLQGDWQPTPSEIIEFLQTAKLLNLSAANFWEWGHTRLYLPQLWDTVKNYRWDAVLTPAEILEQYFVALNLHDADKLLSLYDQNAVHVTGERTISGHDALRIWYGDLFNVVLPDGEYLLGDSDSDVSTVWFRWTAEAPGAVVSSGRDTMGIVNGKIVYHYTSFTLTER